MRAFVIPFPCIHQKILPILFYHEPSVMRNGQLVTEVLKFAVPERKKQEPHTRFSFVCAIPALCFIVSHFSGRNLPASSCPNFCPAPTRPAAGQANRSVPRSPLFPAWSPQRMESRLYLPLHQVPHESSGCAGSPDLFSACPLWSR